MHLSYGSDLLTVREDEVQLIVPQHEHTFVRHEHLKGVDPPLPGQRLHFLFDLQVQWVSKGSQINNDTSFLNHFKLLTHLVTPPRDGDMQRVIAANLGVSRLTPEVVGLQERLTLLGHDKVQDHCGAPRQRGLWTRTDAC